MANPPVSSPAKPHFFQPLLPGFENHLTIHVTFFAKHIEGNATSKILKLRSDISDKTWKVELDGRRLTRGWKDFAIGHALRIGDIVIFKHEGNMVFRVTPFGPSCCEIQYTPSEGFFEQAGTGGDDDNVNHHDIRENVLSFDYCFEANVTASNLKHDQLRLPVGATACNALNKRFREIILVNKEGNPWTVPLRFRESGGMYYLTRGWRRFCVDNSSKVGDIFVFNLVGDGESTPLMCFYTD